MGWEAGELQAPARINIRKQERGGDIIRLLLHGEAGASKRSSRRGIGYDVDDSFDLRRARQGLLMKPQPIAQGTTPTREEPVELIDLAVTLVDGKGGTPAVSIGLPQGEDRYQMQRRIGQGAMGEVFAAKDAFLRRRVAFKRMNPQVAKSPDLATRFLNEAQVTAQLEHPNIIPIYGLESIAGDGVGYAMKFIEGRNLTELLAEERAACRAGTPEQEAHRMADRLRIFTRICDAMAYAHAKGVLHRDLKPDNVMIGHFNQVYVVDWGICRVLRSSEQLTERPGGETPGGSGTQAGSLLGTPSYMSPEQARGENSELDERSDLYALGLILFEIVSLRQAIDGDSLNALIFAAGRGQKAPLDHIDPRISISAELRAIIAKATALQPQDRYSNVAALTADLRSYRNGEAVQALPDNPLRKAMRLISRHRGATLAFLLLFFVIGIGGLFGAELRVARKIARERHHREQVQQLMLAVSQHSHRIDNRIHDYEALLHGLAGQAAQSLGRPDPAGSPIRTFLSEDFAAPERAPPDLTQSARYRQNISLGWPVFKLPPGMNAESVRTDVRAVAELTSTMRAMYQSNGSILYRIFITLESGVHMAYPGRGGYPSEYDGRKRPKYRLAVGQHALRWGNAYLDLYDEPLLAGSLPLYDGGGQFVGVVGIDLSLAELAERLLPLPQPSSVIQVLLVDRNDQVVVEWPIAKALSAQRDTKLGALHDNTTLSTRPLPYPEVIAALRSEPNGGYRERAGKLLAFSPLDTMGWSLVVVAQIEALK
jgi:serine/threonine-protein kinase